MKASWWKNNRTLATFGSGVLLAVAAGMEWTATAASYTDYLFLVWQPSSAASTPREAGSTGSGHCRST